MTTVSVFAPAKINLSLHVTGRRADGYHLLDSLVSFAPVGDRITVRPGTGLSLTVEGPEAAGVPADGTNLALRAAALAAPGSGAALTLEKHLPAASGIGGGSSDAAAAFRGMLALAAAGNAPACGPRAMPPDTLERHAPALVALGADVPMCLHPAPLRARGIGERLDRVSLAPVPAVLVNPRVAVATPAVFAALTSPDNPPMPDTLPDLGDRAALIGFLAACRNDLETPAISVAPIIAEVLGRIAATEGCGLARMSGSGATCFGLFETELAAQAAVDRLHRDHPGWWVAGGVLGDQTRPAMPRIGAA
ncbi:MAG: 4-(cytidine 5'-diphospho)-2-C-methyl-D-erythritol kinase [Rhodobacteraceae bacterium]|nr:4-(cytidine 5'-diphospho)-2-C-methyl-D-erythritol kinase [Paracoccaceae bacterium]